MKGEGRGGDEWEGRRGRWDAYETGWDGSEWEGRDIGWRGKGEAWKREWDVERDGERGRWEVMSGREKGEYRRLRQKSIVYHNP